MVRQRKTFPYIARVLAWVAIGGMVAASGCLAAEGNHTAGGIRRITPMFEMGSNQIDVQAENYFDIVGILNVLENDRIVVGNNELRPASGLRTSGVELSNTVGVKLNQSGEVVQMGLIHNDPH